MKHYIKQIATKLTLLSATFLLLLSVTLPLITSQANAVNIQPSFPNSPLENIPNLNGTVNAVVTAPDGSTYVAGSFTASEPIVNPGRAVFDTATSEVIEGAALPNGTVRAAISDGEGGWYIGGSFTEVGGIARNRLAHLMADGSVNPNFDPNVNNQVHTLALSDDGELLYVGGRFTAVNGSTTRNRLAAIDTNDGIATNFNPNVDNIVNSLILEGSHLYAGGNFTTVNSNITRRGITVISTDNGQATNAVFTANDGYVNNVVSMVLSSDKTKLYASGCCFGENSIGGYGVNDMVGAFNAVNGSQIASFNPPIFSLRIGEAYGQFGSGQVLLSPDDETLYFSGGFTNIDLDTPRVGVAALNSADGSLMDLNLGLGSLGGHPPPIALSSDGTTIYVGGSGVTNYLAGFDTSTGAVTGFNTRLNGQVSIIALVGQRLYATGDFTAYGGQPHNRLLRLLPDNTIDPTFNPDISNATVNSLELDPGTNTLYLGGSFASVNGSTRNGLAALNTNDGTLTDFDPKMNGSVNTLVLDGETLYAGGSFTTVNGSTTRNRLAAFNTTDGLATSFDPNMNSNVSSLVLDGETLYAGGSFTTVNGSTTRNRLAAFNTTTGTATTFDPNMNSSVSSLVLDGETLYAGGGFTTVNGSTTRNRLAAFNTTTGTATDFNPNMNQTVNTILLDGETLYVGGFFTTVGDSVTRNRLAAFDTTTSTATDFNPDMNNTVNTLALNPVTSTLFTGGSFTTVGESDRLNLAAFQNTDYDNDGIPNSQEQSSPNTGDANNDGTPDSQQTHVASILSPTTNNYITLELDEACSITNISLNSESTDNTQDHNFNYPHGLIDFTADCDTPGFTTSVTQYYHGTTPSDSYALRKHNPTTNTYTTIEGATTTSTTIDNQPVITASYSVTDNGALDLDPADGIIRDPAGLALPEGVDLGSDPQDAGGGLAVTGMSILFVTFLAVAGVAAGGYGIYRTRVKRG